MSSTASTSESESTRPADQTTAHQHSQHARINATGDINCNICINPLSAILEALTRSHSLLQTADATVTCAGLITLPCGHHFGRPSIPTWLHHSDHANTRTARHSTCPLCRAPVPRRYVINDEEEKYYEADDESDYGKTKTKTKTKTKSKIVVDLLDVVVVLYFVC